MQFPLVALLALFASAENNSATVSSLESMESLDGVVVDREKRTLHGVVVREDGSAAFEAVVTTSDGGEGVTDESGYFSIDVNVSLGANPITLSARGADGSFGSAEVQGLSSSEDWVPPIVLLLPVDGSLNWLPAAGAQPGVHKPMAVSRIDAMVVFGEGRARSLYAGGNFISAGGISARNIARWNGKKWFGLGKGLRDNTVNSTEVNAMTGFDDGSGFALYAAGRFSRSGTLALNNIARWDGASWSAVGAGLNGTVNCLQVFDDGTGPALYAGGEFTASGGQPVPWLARWDGSSWSTVGGGLSGPGSVTEVRSMTVFDDGTGRELCVGGTFNSAGGVAINGIAKWDGTNWSALGAGLTTGPFAMGSYNDGTGAVLFATGEASGQGGSPDYSTWDGVEWTAGDTSLQGSIRTFFNYDDGSGPVLLAAGSFTFSGTSIFDAASWDGTSWSPVGSGVSFAPDSSPGSAFYSINALAVYRDGSNSALFAGGSFGGAGGNSARNICKFDGTDWSQLTTGLDGPVKAQVVFDDGSGPALYIGGQFFSADGERMNSIARWDGTTLSPVGLRFTPGSDVRGLAVFDDGTGPALYACGKFNISPPTAETTVIARFDGSQWTQVVSGSGGASVNCMAVYDDGTGPALFYGGTLSINLSKWDGVNSSKVDSLGGGTVSALGVFDDGTGPLLYLGGSFNAFDPIADERTFNIAAWGGAGVISLQGGAGSFVGSFAVYDDGGGPDLYVGGGFSSVGVGSGATLAQAKGVARWDGSAWSILEEIVNSNVRALHVFDDGSGLKLYAGGTFFNIGSTEFRRLAKWDGSSWSSVKGRNFNDGVLSLIDHDDGSGAALFVGGDFTVSDKRDSYFAKLGQVK